MTARTGSSFAYRTCSLMLAAVLLLAAPAAALAETTSTPTPQPAPSPAPAPSPTPSPQAPPPQQTPRTPPADDEPAVEVPVDPETERFREELARRQALLDEFLAQLDALDRELAIAAEQYNAAVERLNATKQRVSVAQEDLVNAEQAYELQNELLGKRATSIYKLGSFAAIELVLEAKSLSDFLSRLKFMNTLGMADAEVAKSLLAQKELVEETASRLENAEHEAEALEFELRARQIEIMLRIQDRQQMMAEAQGDLLELLDSEAARRQREESALLRQILSGASQAGIVIETGSPIETALAYHGVPYLWGGESPAGFDCSGLVLYVFRQHGVNLPHYSGSQFLLGQKIAPAALQPGDVVFFGSPIYHVGIYMGADYFIHAPRTGDFVKISRLSARRDYAGARRYNWIPRIDPPQGVGDTGPLASVGRW
ncbi:MAG: NlpC/P60 family protein [Anaerosomatales bacterium]|nr:NlpC/P60 family protein [Anaerosomatales bacterium]MDT8433982.1 NlpC/P60 family protein [Anaerosomatales bacterium]